MSMEMRLRRRPERRAALLGAVVVAVQVGWIALGIPGRQTASDLLFIVVPTVCAPWCFQASRRLVGRARTCWALFGVCQIGWALYNAYWATYEVILRRQVPVPSPGDPVYIGALVVGVVAIVLGLLPLVQSRSGAWRVVFDVAMSGGALLFLAWILVLGPALGGRVTTYDRATTWLYPALEVTAATLAFATMSRVAPRARLPWLLVGVGFLVGAAVDSVWAYANLSGGFNAGSLVDPLWVVTYGLVGIAALAVTGDAGLGSARITPARWESVGAYVPLALVLPATVVQELRGVLTDGMRVGALALAGVVIVRQMVAVLENDKLARTLESRVEQRTSELRASEAHFRSIVSSISDVVLILGADRRIRYQSPATRLLGYEGEELLGQRVDDFCHSDDLAAARVIAATQPQPLATDVYVSRVRHKDGSWRHMEATVTDLLENPHVQGIVVALRDVGERVELEERLRHQAFHDGLTGLANRALLHNEIEGALAAGGRPSLLLIDLDEFKAVNDTAGHDLGDEVLVAVARRLVHATRPGDIVSRLGGDEFAVVLPDDERAHAAVAVADRVLHALRMPLVVKGRPIRCLGSIGVAAAAPGATAAGLLRDADVAMYVAKERGKGRVELFTSGMRDTLLLRQGLEDLVRRAVPDRRLVVHYQPMIDLLTGEVVGAEALLRLRGDDGQLVSPLEFIPIAEELGVIGEMGSCVLIEACRAAAQWQGLRPDGPPFDVAVNLSTRQLEERTLPRQVAAALELAGLPAHLLTLEITEGALAADPNVEATLRSLRELGVRLSIDDFGAGYSSLGRLRDFPVDELKIDRSFIAEIGETAEAPLVDAILAMADSLGLSVVAEGIELPEQARAMQQRGCTRGQGYLYGRPLAVGEIEGVLVAPACDLTRSR